MKKILTLVLALCMLSSYAFAEDLIENIDVDPGFPVVKEPVSVTIALVPQSSAVDFQVEQNWMTEYINRNSGLDIEWMVIDATAASERIPLMLNSGDMPDAILGHAFQANDIAQYGTSEGMFYPVNELLDYMPIFSAFLEENPAVREGITTTDGNIYGFPALNNIYSYAARFFIDQTWLDRLGLENPTTLEEFKKDLGDKLKERRQTQADRAYEDALMDQVVEALEVELPDAMVDYRAEQMVQDYAQRITSQGIPFEKYLEMTGQTMDRMKEQAKESAIKQIKYEMAMDAVAAAEGIVISDEELDAEYQSLADQYKMELDQVKALASAEDVRTTLLRRKAIDVVKDSAKVGKAKKPAAKKAAKETEDETAEEKPKKKAASKKRAETEQAPKTEE